MNTQINKLTDAELTALLKDTAHDDLDNNELFQWLYGLTMAIYDLDPKDYRVSHLRFKRWTDLGNIWGTCPPKGAYNIFVLAIHKLHWGVLPSRTSSGIPREMIDAVIAELLKDGDAYRGWKKSKHFVKAFKRILRQDHPLGGSKVSYRFSEYLRCRTCFYIIHKAECPPIYDFMEYTYTEHRSIVRHAATFAVVRNYETVLTKLVPEASSWSDAQWRNMSFQFNKIKDVHGVDFNENYINFDALFAFLERLWCHNDLSLAALVLIKEMSDSIMNIIWPHNTKRKVTRQFRIAHLIARAAKEKEDSYDFVPFFYTKENLERSWLFHRCREWVYANDLDGAAPGTKKAIMELSMDI